MQKDLDSMTIDEAQLLVSNGSSNQEKIKGLRGLARQATHGAAEQTHIASGGSLHAAVMCMKANLESPGIQRAGCVLIVNLARKTSAAGYGRDDVHSALLTTTHHHENVASHARHQAPQSQQSEETPWLRRAVVDAGGLDAIVGVGGEIGCMGEYTAAHVFAHSVDACNSLAVAHYC
jgi:hypothetical protein